MTSNVLPIAEEFLRSSEPQRRKNALTALSIIGDKESVKLIAETALNDENKEVRQRARTEIATLYEKASDDVASVFAEALTGKDQKKQERAYEVLGILKSMGTAIPNARLRLRDKLRLAAMMYSHLYSQKKWSFQLRAWKPALLGSAVGGGTFILGLLIRQNRSLMIDWPNYILLFLVAVLGGAVLGLSATQRTTPIYTHINRFEATLVEVLVSSLTGLVGAVCFNILISTIIRIPAVEYINDRGLILIIFLGIILLIGAVRAGTILAFGIYHGSGANQLAQTVAGASAGFWIALGFILTVENIGGEFSSRERWLLVMTAFPLLWGCAYAFATIDREAPPIKRRLTVAGRALRPLLTLGLLLLDSFILFILLVQAS
jgi:hypothetical protein